jgi:hypothetical protein
MALDKNIGAVIVIMMVALNLFLQYGNKLPMFLVTPTATENIVGEGSGRCNCDHHPKKIDSGWDSFGHQLYKEKVFALAEAGITNTSVWPPGSTEPFYVSKDECQNRGFWDKTSNGGWERLTFKIFNKYISNTSTVVDFGTWIGPTLLYHGQYSFRSFGMEADPFAFAVAEFNVELNRKLIPNSWAGRVTVDSGCISTPEDVGNITMRAGGNAGKSMSHINKNVGGSVKWNVRCYTLPDIFENYWGIRRPYKDVFIKIMIG